MVARNNSAACGCRCGWLLNSTPMSAQPTSRAHARPPCRALDSYRRGATANRPLRGFGVPYLGQRPPLCGRPFSLLHPPPQAIPRVAGVCPPCCPTPTLPPCRLSWLPRSSAVHPRLPAGPSPPASFVAPSHANVACGHFLLHERLELLLTCAPGGYDKASALAQIFACMAIPPLALARSPLAPPPPPPAGARFSRKR